MCDWRERKKIHKKVAGMLRETRLAWPRLTLETSLKQRDKSLDKSAVRSLGGYTKLCAGVTRED